MWNHRDLLSRRTLWTLAVFASACSSQQSAPEVAVTQQAVWTNGDFESDAIGVAASGWTSQTFLNPALTQVTPQTYASLNLGAGGQLQSLVVGGATESQIDPDLGAGGSIRFPKYGLRALRINYLNNSTTANKGASKNVNVVQQTMTTTLGDVDPTDNKIHVRFALAPVLQNPSHTFTQQPYYFVDLRNLTTGATLYQDFNTSGQAGVPWITTTSVLDSTVVYYTNWQLVDVAPGNAAIRVGDQLTLRVVAAGCSPSGHWGRVYLDAVGSGIPGIYTWMTGPQSANSGSNLTYTVNYKNGGTTTASGTKLDFVTPPSTTFVSVSTPGSCTAPAMAASGTVSCTLGTLSQGAVSSYTITVKIDAAASGTITNGNYSIYATGVSALIGPKVQTTVTSSVTYADVSVTKSDGIAAIAWGQALTYVMRVANAGPAAATSVTLADTLPAQLTGATWTCVPDGGGTCTSSGSGDVNDTLSLPVGAGATYTVNANIIAGSGSSSVTNTATVSVTGVSDPDNTNDTAVDTDNIGSLRTLTVTKTAGANGGTITSSPASIGCGPACSSDSGSFLDSSTVILSAAPVPGSSFLGWGGACSGTASTCTLTMTGDQSVSASFTPAPTLAYSSGSPQSAAISTAFGSALSVLLTDSAGAPVVGSTVYFSAPSTGARATLSAASAVTNASGIASVTATANATAGSYVVTATNPSASGSISFSLANYGAATSISVVSGTGQSTAVTTAFASALNVVVRDAASVPVPGVTVTFTATGSTANATLGAATAVTAANGTASVSATANTIKGAYSVTAAVSGVGTNATFALTNSAGPADTIVVSGGATQSATVAAAFATALSVTVRDAQSNLVPGAVVSFAVPGSGASATLSSASATTNASGVASVTATANTSAGAYSVTATVAALTPLTFALTNTASSATQVQASSGSDQSTTVGTAFGSAVIGRVVDTYGNAVSGVTISFAVPGSGASATLSTTSGSSDALGQVSITASANTLVGAYNVNASVIGIASPASFALSNTVGAVASISALSGSGQNRGIGTAFSAPLFALVRDSYSNPIAGVTVTFSVPSSGASSTLNSATAVTDVSGQASVNPTANLIAGSYSVSAAPPGAITPAMFSLTNNPGAAASVTAAGGGGQSAAVSAAFAIALSVTVRDAQSNPVPGVTVNFSVPGGASAVLGAASAVTSSLGVASVSATANNVAGAYLVTAAVASVGSATFALTNLPGPVASIAVTSGSSQHATVTQAFVTALTATVNDAHGNPVPGVAVSFSAPSSGASAMLSGNSATSDASGVASVTVIATSVAGGYNVTANATGAASPASFALSNDPGAASSIVASGGGGQSATVTSAFASMLTATVLDAYSNPVPGVTLTFTPPATGVSATLGGPSVVTNGSGVATSGVTANNSAGTYSVVASITTPGITALFGLTNVAGGVGSIAAVSGGGGQHAVVGALYAAGLRVRVVDAFSNPVQGALVSYSLSVSAASAQLSSATAMSDSSGEAAITATADHVAGAYTVSASAPGAASPVVFTLTNDPGAAASIVASSGSSQSATVATAFGLPLTATVLDTYGNLVPAINVTFSAPGSAASAALVGASATSNSSGQAIATATANQVAGGYSVTAAASGGLTATFTLANLVGSVGTIAAVSGGAQSATVNAAFALPLTVIVSDGFGNPVPGTTVTFALPSSGATGTPSSGTALTDSAGHANVSVTANSVAGSYSVSASAPGAASPVLFPLTNHADVAASIAVDSGTSQSATVDSAFAAPLQVRVLDAYGNAVASESVAFSAPSSGASVVLSSASAVTNTTGYTSVTATADSIAGSFAVVASLTAGASTSFMLTNTAGAVGSIATTSGSGQTATVNTAFAAPLLVTVLDAHNNPVPGVTVSLSVPSSGASAILSAPSAITDVNGQISVTASASSTTGSFVVTATAAGAASPAFISLVNTAGSASGLNISAGSGQSATVLTAYGSALVVSVLDADGNGVPNVAVTFVAPSSGATATLGSASSTDAQGNASVSALANSVAGSYSVTASAAGIATPVTFALTNTAGAVGSIAAVSGGGQSTIVDTAFTTALTVSVLDAQGNPVPGATVSFATPSGGASASLGASSALTDSAGQASVSATANAIAGSYSVTATVPGAASPTAFALINSPAAVASISVVSGSGQSTAVAGAFGSELRVRVSDAYDNPVPGVSVTFTAPASAASAVLSSLVATSDALGEVSVSATANAQAGSYAVLASAPGAASTASFALANTPGGVSSVAAVSGSGQLSTVAAAFASPLVVVVRDAFSNPIPGVTVSFGAPSSGASAQLSNASAVTDGSGQASVSASANQIAGMFAVSVTAPGPIAPATFALVNAPGAAAMIAAIGGNSQTVTVSHAFPAALSVSVVDVYGNAVPGAIVFFSAPVAAASATLSASALATDARGQASVTAIASSGAGDYVVSAAVGDVALPASFALSNVADAPASVAAANGGGQSTLVTAAFASALAVRVADAQNNPVPGVTVSFAAPAGASASLSAASAVTDALGLASVTATANNLAGGYLVTASVASVGSASFALTNLAGAAVSIAATAGTAQHAPVTTAFATPLTATVSDAQGNPVPGVAVTFAAPSSAASATLGSSTVTSDASGVVHVTASANSAAGSYDVSASAAGVATPASFALNNDPGPVSSIVASGGGGQSATVQTAFGSVLTATAFDAYGNPVPGVTLSFTAPASGFSAALGSASAVTDSLGEATSSATANAQAGTYSVSATLTTSGLNAIFLLTNVAGPVGSIAAIGGADQHAVVATAFATGMRVRVLDSLSNPVPGALVSFSLSPSAASAELSGASALTDVAGEAVVTATADHVSGAYTVTASAAGAASPAIFALTNDPGPVASIVADGGGDQSAMVATAFVAPLSARVLDAFGNAVPSISVAFAVPSSGASALMDGATVITDVSGHARVAITANNVAGGYSATAAISGGFSAGYALTNLVGAVGSIAAVSGGAQTATVNSAFALPLAVIVSDGFGNPVSGSVVTFSVPGTGASGVLSGATALTDNSGYANISIVANAAAGSFAVTAIAPGAASPVSFPLTNHADVAASVAAVSGAGQSAMVDGTFAAPLRVRVLDAAGNPVANEPVAFSAPASGASVVLSSAGGVTDAGGYTSVAATADSIAGPFAVTAALGGGASANFMLTNTAGAVGAIVTSSGAGQSTTVNTAFATPLRLTVIDAHNNPVAGATVSLSVPSAGASALLSASSAISDANGEISVTATANNTTGNFVVSASAPGAASPAFISLTNTPGSAAALSIRTGSGQSAMVLTSFSASLVVSVLDADGNGVPGMGVTFLAPSTGASASLGEVSNTDALGNARVSVIANGVAGSYSVTATATGIATPVTFALTNTAGAVGSIAAVSGGGQSAAVDAAFAGPLTVRVLDSEGNPVSGATVSFTVPSSAASALLDMSTAVTDPLGQASVSASANTFAGSYAVTAAVPGAASPATFALANLATVAASISPVSGTAQSTAVTSAFGNALQVRVSDQHGNPVAGSVVTFAASSSGASVDLSSPVATTDASGLASISGQANSLAGSYEVLATVSGVTAPASFALTNRAGAPAAISVAAGDNQNAVVTTAFASALVVQVRDVYGNAVSAVSVEFAAIGGAASAVLDAMTRTTDADGRASVQAIANAQAGSYRVEAAVVGVASVASFAMSNQAAAAASIAVATGTGQSAGVLAPFAQPLVVTVHDAQGNPVPGVLVQFATATMGAAAMLSSPSALTDAAGQASVNAIANAIAGAYQVSAWLPDAVHSAVFELGNFAGIVSVLTVGAGTGQSAQVATPFALPLSAAVFDAQHNPVPGVLVSFSAPTSGPSAVLSAVSAISDSAGQVSITARASDLTGGYNVTASSAGVIAPVVFALTNLAGTAATLEPASGGGQSAPISSAFPAPLVLTVRDGLGNPVPNARVRFAAPSSGASASLGTASATTDSAGQVSLIVTANNVAGTYAIVATLEATAASTSFALTNQAAAPAQIWLVSGDAQSAVVHVAFANPLSVLVVDASGNPVPNVHVGFAMASTAASATLSAEQVSTDDAGHATVRAAANGGAGSHVVSASVPGIAPVSFTLHNLPGLPTRIVVASDEASRAGTVNTALGSLSVSVTDADGNPVSGVSLSFSAPSTGPSAILSASRVVSDGSGRASVTAQANAIAGTFLVSVTGDGYSAAFMLTNLAGAANVLVVESGANASAVVQSEFDAELSVRVDDADGNPVPGARVVFSAPDSGASAMLSLSVVDTDDTGHASISITAGTIAGAYSVTASLASAEKSVSFSLTNLAGSAAHLQPMAATTPQATQVGTAYAHALGARVSDAFDNPIAGGTVQFSAPSTGPALAFAQASQNSDALGQVVTAATANQFAGAFSVTATLSGSALTATFQLNNLAGPANILELVTGSLQDATVGEAYGAALQVVVHDAYGNPVEHATVTFSSPSSGASATLSSSSATTDGDGHASVNATAGTQAGMFDVAAVSDGAATPVTFHLHNVSAAAAAIVAVAGSTPQSAAVATAFSAPLRVSVSDAYGNPVAGASVQYTVPTVDASALLSSTTVLTDDEGFAEVDAIASSTPGDYAISAALSGIDAVASFALTNTSDAPALLVLSSGDQQHASAGSDFAMPLAFEVSDASGRPASAASLTFLAPQAPSANVSVLAEPIVSDVHGHAEATIHAGDVLGEVLLVVSTDGGAAPVMVHLIVDGIPTTLTLSVDQANPNASAPIPVSATVASATRVPEGRVQFLADDRQLAQAVVHDGVAHALVLLTPGSHQLRASFVGNAPFAASESDSFAATVTEDEGSLTGSGGTCSLVRAGSDGAHGWLWVVMIALLAWTARRRAWLRALALMLCLTASQAHAQNVGGLALDRFHPAPAGSDWFALDSLAIADHLRWSARLVMDFANHPLVVRNADGSQRAVPVSQTLTMHANGSLTLFSRWRVGLSVPVVPFQQGERSVYNGYALGDPSPASGDIAVRGDYLLAGAHDAPMALAIGVDGHVPTGSRNNFTSDGTFGIEPHLAAAGRLSQFIYAAQVGFLLRGTAHFAGQSYGHEWHFALSAGVNTWRDRLVIGPEILLATPLSGRSAAETFLGVHYTWNEHWHVGLGFGVGLNDSLGTPRERGLLYIEYSGRAHSRSTLPNEQTY